MNEGKVNLDFEIDGIEVMNNGITNFYFRSAPVPKELKALKIRFDLMMDSYPKQQNKITLRKEKETYIALFTNNSRVDKITVK